MDIRVGTSGYQYKQWRGGFYPEGCKEKDMLRLYAARLSTVEINNTFYRMPKESVLTGWMSQVPPEFRFVLKASRTITHIKRLRDCTDSIDYLCRTARVMGEQLSALLFQLPPNLKRDPDRLVGLLKAVPSDLKVALEFRHESWFDDDIYKVLREYNAALCTSETDDDGKPLPFVTTADWGYLRLRKESYEDDELQQWATRVKAEGWKHGCIFFKHEEQGPMLAERLTKFIAAQP